MSVEEVLLRPKEAEIKELNKLVINNEVELQYIENFIFSSNNARLIYLCGKHIEWINMGRVAHALSNTLDDYYILEYAHYIQDLKDIPEEQKKTILKELGKGMVRCKPTFRAYYYARDILYAPIDNLASTLSKSNDATYIFYMLRDLGDRLQAESKEKLERRVIELNDSRNIVFVANIASEGTINEFGKSLLNAKKTELYAVHLCMFLSEHKIEDKELKSKIIEAIMQSGDYRRIINLLKSTDDVPYMEIIDHILSENDNAKNPDFWISYIIPLALCVKPCSGYATDKIIESNNAEVITITIYYIENDELRAKLQEALDRIPNLEQEYKKTNLQEKVIARVREIKKED